MIDSLIYQVSRQDMVRDGQECWYIPLDPSTIKCYCTEDAARHYFRQMVYNWKVQNMGKVVAIECMLPDTEIYEHQETGSRVIFRITQTILIKNYAKQEQTKPQRPRTQAERIRARQRHYAENDLFSSGC